MGKIEFGWENRCELSGSKLGTQITFPSISPPPLPHLTDPSNVENNDRNDNDKHLNWLDPLRRWHLSGLHLGYGMGYITSLLSLNRRLPCPARL